MMPRPSLGSKPPSGRPTSAVAQIIMGVHLVTRTEEARRARGEDRIAVVESPGRKLILVADGAGGVAGGAAAAESLCSALTADTDDWSAWLKRQDTPVSRGTGLAAVVVLSVTDGGMIRGASVGDCEAWMFFRGEVTNLTERQIRKPLLGDGAAVPVGFAIQAVVGATIVIASDGLWKYVSRHRIEKAVAMRPLESAVDALVDAARLPNGIVQDDIAIAILEMS